MLNKRVHALIQRISRGGDYWGAGAGDHWNTLHIRKKLPLCFYHRKAVKYLRSLSKTDRLTSVLSLWARNQCGQVAGPAGCSPSLTHPPPLRPRPISSGSLLLLLIGLPRHPFPATFSDPSLSQNPTGSSAALSTIGNNTLVCGYLTPVFPLERRLANGGPGAACGPPTVSSVYQDLFAHDHYHPLTYCTCFYSTAVGVVATERLWPPEPKTFIIQACSKKPAGPYMRLKA